MLKHWFTLAIGIVGTLPPSPIGPICVFILAAQSNPRLHYVNLPTSGAGRD